MTTRPPRPVLRSARHTFGRYSHCPDCGAPVLTFVDEIGCTVLLDDELPVTADPAEERYRDRLYELRGQWIGWVHLHHPVRTWRPLRTAHVCRPTPPAT
jgi:hypothetical protein